MAKIKETCMGWQSRLPKDQKPEFKKTCNKCGDTGVRRTFISVAGIPARDEVKCSCIKKNEDEIEKLAVQGRALLAELQTPKDQT
jgi:hypothetical protein